MTPRHAYYPSVADYRVPGDPQRRILELPMSVLPIAAPYDTETVLRYVNPAYRPEIFEKAIADADLETIVTVTHPQEVSPVDEPHGLLSADPLGLRRNLQFLGSLPREVQWTTITDLAAQQQRPDAAIDRSTADASQPQFRPPAPPAGSLRRR